MVNLFKITPAQLAILCDVKPYEHWVSRFKGLKYSTDYVSFIEDIEPMLKKAKIEMSFEEFHYLGIDQNQKISDNDPRVIELEKIKTEILDQTPESDDYKHFFKSFDEYKKYKEIMTSLVMKDFKLGRFPSEIAETKNTMITMSALKKK